jgi:hypothetical protein
VKCGKKTCHCYDGKGHGPYWYVYWTEGARTRKKYIGKNPANAGAILKGLNVRLTDKSIEEVYRVTGERIDQ